MNACSSLSVLQYCPFHRVRFLLVLKDGAILACILFYNVDNVFVICVVETCRYSIKHYLYCSCCSRVVLWCLCLQ